MRKINKIILHCSASSFGDTAVITNWHHERGFETIGYHYIILNGSRSKSSYHHDEDGLLEIGRDINIAGAHSSGDNADSIGICLIGEKDFTKNQFATLDKLLKELMQKYSIPAASIIGHYETTSGKSQGKTCPNFDVAKLRENLNV